MNNNIIKLKLDNKTTEKVNSNNLKAKDIIQFILENTYLHFKITDIKGALEKENVYNQLSLNKIYNDDEKTIKKAYIENNNLYLEF